MTMHKTLLLRVAQLDGTVKNSDCIFAEEDLPMSVLVAQLTGAVEYPDCISLEG